MPGQLVGSLSLPLAAPLLLLLLLTPLLAGLAAGLLADDAPQVQPFSDQLLAESQRTGRPLAGLGRVACLSTMMAPRWPQTDGATEFSVFAGDQSVRGLKFRLPAEGGPDPFQFDLGRLKEVKFEPEWRTVLMVAGYKSKAEVQWVGNATREWLTLFDGQINVIQVSWASSNQGVYPEAVANSRLVARQIVIFLHYLAQVHGLNLFDGRDQAAGRLLDNLHLIGHSLGAHIVGFVGQDLGGRAGRITGLDPAGPSFDQLPRSQRLDRSQAQLVEVLHSNMGSVSLVKLLARATFETLKKYAGLKTSDGLMAQIRWFGIDRQLGHLDFYANDGRAQPNLPPGTMSHRRAYEIYVDILRRENELRALRNSAAGAALAPSRLLAFKAKDYNSFQWGANLAAGCPALVSAPTHLDRGRAYAQSLAACAVPLLDLASPSSSLIGEYRDKFGIEFGPEAKPEEQPRFYFATSASGSFFGSAPSELASENLRPINPDSCARNRLVGEHYLAKIYLAERPNWTQQWGARGQTPPVCSLKLILALHSESVALELAHLPSELANWPANRPANLTEQQLVVAVPFVHPAGIEAAGELEQLARHFELDLFRRHFPKLVQLTLIRSETAEATGTTCGLSISAVEVQALGGLGATPGKGLAALYGQSGWTGGSSELQFFSADQVDSWRPAGHKFELKADNHQVRDMLNVRLEAVLQSAS